MQRPGPPPGAKPVDAAGVKKRKVRKGTHSCWECRRRKTRCHFDSQNDTVCAGCKTRGTACNSQEYDDERVQVPHDRRIAQRLSRLENLMERLVDQVQPKGGGVASASAPDALVSLRAAVRVGGHHPRRRVCNGADTGALSCPGTNGPAGTTPRLSSKASAVNKSLLEIYPSRHDVELILGDITGNKIAMGVMYTHDEVLKGHYETREDMMRRPTTSTPPAILGKRLLYFALCLHHIPPSFDLHQFETRRTPAELVVEYMATVSNLVCLDDELVGSPEGLEVMVLHLMCQISVGNLRKAWISARRALSLGELMGPGRQGRFAALQHTDPESDPTKRPSPVVVWFHINYFERYLSLLLGLPTAARDESLAVLRTVPNLTSAEKLEISHGLLTGRIIGRNTSGTENEYVVTMGIDSDLKAAADEMPAGWWTPVDGDSTEVKLPEGHASTCRVVGDIETIIVQSRHYSLVIMLHLPYILRSAVEPQWAHSKTMCLSASREVLWRYTRFRRRYGYILSCRHMDFFALVASMTLILGYLGRASGGVAGEMETRLEDRQLVDSARSMMAAQAKAMGDKVTGDAAEVVAQLMPVIDRGVGSCTEARDAIKKGLRLQIPYLGTVNITDPIPEKVMPATDMGEAEWAATGYERGNGDEFPAASFEGGDMDPQLFLSVDTGFMDAGVPLQGGQMGGVGEQGVGVGGHLPEADLNGNLASLDIGDTSMLGSLEAQTMMQPGLMADSEDWSFQGIDTTYWSLLNGGYM
ncbi:uncharacterized protein DNG_09812 [Cephalotrichum gorgonifer]|uniref:Zn(2)-C6 fungal-type domain-containing protein n=1 Tax=Cephalotrichum gorgonifer TaxID=2041049 RepID=A0AAE8N879_9PEZI|nr:uncharacterized protein DNG_09812 [Cephalotrichum gorgonifer]